MNILIFDYDGVIADSLDVFMKLFVGACVKNDFDNINSKEKFLDLFDGNLHEKMIDSGCPKVVVPRILKDLEEEFLKYHDKTHLFEGVRDMLRELSQNNKMFIVTSNVTNVVKQFLESEGIACFEDIIGADKETSKVKKIESIKSKLGKNDYFYIGDTKGDIIEGRKAGAKTIAVTWGWHDEERLKKAKPDFIVHTPMELVRLFKGE